MPAAEARIPTDRASRYLVQLCRHMDRLDHPDRTPDGGGHHHGAHAAHDGPAALSAPAVVSVEHSDTAGTVRFADGRWTLSATADTLTLRVAAADEAALRRLRDAVTARVATVGRRDGLRADWHTVTEPPPGVSSTAL
ncbi:DUF2218 domain-containing protein [Actinacidiphila alni]|uniref:DUF2218 domain-containing protein n=1 Tax=Actinacidiphila alni TaxID=380248 RepID=UPI0033D44497